MMSRLAVCYWHNYCHRSFAALCNFTVLMHMGKPSALISIVLSSFQDTLSDQLLVDISDTALTCCAVVQPRCPTKAVTADSQPLQQHGDLTLQDVEDELQDLELAAASTLPGPYLDHHVGQQLQTAAPQQNSKPISRSEVRLHVCHWQQDCSRLTVDLTPPKRYTLEVC